jgi:hypothetical protein
LNIRYSLLTTGNKLKKALLFFLSFLLVFIFSFFLIKKEVLGQQKSILENMPVETDEIISPTPISEPDEELPSSPEQEVIVIPSPTPIIIRPVIYEINNLQPPKITAIKIDGKQIPLEVFFSQSHKEIGNIHLEGKGEPNSELYLFFKPQMYFAKTQVGPTGNWQIELVPKLEEGEHFLELKQFKGGDVSPRTTYSFKIQPKPKEVAENVASNNTEFISVAKVFFLSYGFFLIVGLTALKASLARKKEVIKTQS